MRIPVLESFSYDPSPLARRAAAHSVQETGGARPDVVARAHRIMEKEIQQPHDRAV